VFCCDALSANKRTHAQAQSRANQHTSRAAREKRCVREERGIGVLNCLVWGKGGSIGEKGPPQISTHSLIHEQDVRTRKN